MTNSTMFKLPHRAATGTTMDERRQPHGYNFESKIYQNGGLIWMEKHTVANSVGADTLETRGNKRLTNDNRAPQILPPFNVLICGYFWIVRGTLVHWCKKCKWPPSLAGQTRFCRTKNIKRWMCPAILMRYPRWSCWTFSSSSQSSNFPRLMRLWKS